MKATDRCVVLMVLSLVMMVVYIFSLMNHIRFQLIDDEFSHINQSQGHFTRIYQSKSRSIPLSAEFYDLSNVLNHDFRCVDMNTTPSTPICIHSIYDDMYISHDLLETGLWEKHVLFDFLDILQRDSSLGVIDLGANIGVYSLLGAAMGRQVVAVEPFMANILRLHAASQMAGTSSLITLMHNGISDQHGNATIIVNGSNQGDIRLRDGVNPCVGSCPKTIRYITMGDIVNVLPFSRAVMKIDIQGYEHLAFLHATELLNILFLPCIYMEWTEIKKHHPASASTPKDYNAVLSMLHLLYNSHYVPYTLDNTGAVNLKSYDWWEWPDDIVWRLLPNKDEKSQIMKNHYRHWPT